MNRFIRLKAASNKSRELWIIFAALAILGMSFSFSVENDKYLSLPLKSAPLIPKTCLMKSILKIDCPVCGMTRSFVCYSHGELRKGWQLHRLGIIVYLLILLQLPYRVFILISGKSIAFLSNYKFIQMMVYSLLILFMLNWIFNLFTGNMTP